MNASKILALVGCAALLTLPAPAEVYADAAPAAAGESVVGAGEQAAAAEIRTRLASGTFCVAYVRDGAPQRLIAQAGSRLAQTGREGGKKANAIQYKAMYKDGSYYQFDYDGSKPFARVLPADMLMSPALNPEENWLDVPDDLALPEELRIFFADEQFARRAPSVTAPAYETSKELTVGGKTYTADVYKSSIRTQAGTTAGYLVYHALYSGGQLARMMQESAVALGINLRALVEASDGSTGQVTVDKAVGEPADLDAVRALIDGADVLTFEHEHIPAPTMEEAARLVSVQPPASALLYAQDKLAMRERLTEMGIPCPAWACVEDEAQLAEFGATIGWPLIVKTPRGGYDGHGVAVAHSPADVSSWWGNGLLLAEALVPFTGEVAALLARTPSGEIASWPVASTVQIDGVCAEVTAPAAGIRPETAAEAQRIGERIAAELGVTGVLAVEMFVVGDTHELVVNEIAPRPHNSGHHTLDACAADQFQQQVRIMCNLPPADTKLLSSCCMANILGDVWQEDGGEPNWLPLQSNPNAHLHLYGKKAARKGRKMGHFTVLSADADTAFEAAVKLHQSL